jgi:hypothetical protein
MVSINTNSLLSQSYRNLFLVQNCNFWDHCPYEYDPRQDVVLTFDFALQRRISSGGGTAYYLDHLVGSETMQHFNFETYEFFAKWHYDKDGNDIFSYKGCDFGNAFRIEIWNDITYYIRIFLNLLVIKGTSHNNIYAGISDSCTLALLDKLNIQRTHWDTADKTTSSEYYFPIFRYMDESLRPVSVSPKDRARLFASLCLDILFRLSELVHSRDSRKPYVFLSVYHPIVNILERLKNDGLVRVVTTSYSLKRNPLKHIRLPIRGYRSQDGRSAEELLEKFDRCRFKGWKIDGIDVGDILFEVIQKRIKGSLPHHLQVIDSIVDFFSGKDLRFMVTFTSIGAINCLMMNYCRTRNIPVYLIINGFLSSYYLDEAKNATWINSYGESEKMNYFSGMKNIVCLGDPRMDAYAQRASTKALNRARPTIVIGAGGFSNIDLNSYVAFEFVFLNDIMTVCKNLMAKGREMDLVIKVRPNGYIEQYMQFVNEYYSDIHVTIYDNKPMKEVLELADLYITIYSQTLFEASCLGIPAIYYKRDVEYMHTPFDGKAELVTAFSPEGLEETIELFYTDSPIFNKFNSRTVMEKYIGPLDGNNTRRNVEFIYSLMFQGGPQKDGQYVSKGK